MTTTPRVVRAALASLVLALLAIVATGCGNAITADVIGMTAMSVDDQGRPVVLVAVCSQHIDRVEVVRTREGLDPSEPNPTVGSWSSDQNQSGTVTVDVARPGAEWTASGPIEFQADKGYIVIASRSDADAEATQVSFIGRDLAALEPGQVIVRNARVWTRDRFDSESCS